LLKIDSEYPEIIAELFQNAKKRLKVLSNKKREAEKIANGFARNWVHPFEQKVCSLLKNNELERKGIQKDDKH
jgi:hypothetical protein